MTVVEMSFWKESNGAYYLEWLDADPGGGWHYESFEDDGMRWHPDSDQHRLQKLHRRVDELKCQFG